MTDALSDILKEHEYAIRYKASDGGAMIVGRDGQPWSLTQKYYKTVAAELVDRYEDWQPLVPGKHAAYLALHQAVLKGEVTVKIHGRFVSVMAPITDAASGRGTEEEATSEGLSPVTDAAIKSAGQVAEALGIAIAAYIDKDRGKADRAVEQLHWIARGIGWQIKENRHEFQPKWNQTDAPIPEQSEVPSDREPQGDGGTEEQGGDRVR